MTVCVCVCVWLPFLIDVFWMRVVLSHSVAAVPVSVSVCVCVEGGGVATLPK